MMFGLSPVGGLFVWAYLAFSFTMQLLEQYLEVRQLRKNRETEVPSEFRDTVDTTTFLEAQAYQKDKRIFGFYREWITFFWGLVGLFVINPAAWALSVHIVGKDAEYSCTLLWLFLMTWADKPIAIPLSLYSNFVVEEKHGFNKMTLKLFITDLLKSEAIAYVLAAALIPLFVWIVRASGRNFYLYLWASAQLLIFAFMWIFPNVIQPMFNKFEALKDETLRKQIEDLAAEVNFPLTQLFQIDGSKRSGHSNAYFFGFWKYKRIVLYDTLLHLKHEDILAILCHELGHWKFGHTVVNLVISSVLIFVRFWLFGVVMYSGDLSKNMVYQFGYGDSDAVFIQLTLFFMLFSPTEQVLSLCMTMLSRRFEFQADSFAATKGRAVALQSGLFQIHQENKGDLNPDPWYSWYHFSHPPLIERVRALKALQGHVDVQTEPGFTSGWFGGKSELSDPLLAK